MSTPATIHPDNPKLFLYRGEPRILLTATEHYGAVMNRPFDYGRYLRNAAKNGMTVTRLFTLFRELQSACNPYSTCKPESTDYEAPFRRTGPGSAMDIQPQYDLDQPNPEFYERLHGFLSMASDLGILVEVVLMSNTYGPDVWALNPLNAPNNVNDVESIEWWDYNTLRHPKLLARQTAHVRRIVTETNPYDNVIFEVCNEPGGGLCGPGMPTPEDVNSWLTHMIGVIRDTEAALPNRHLIAGQEAFAYKLPDEERNLLDVHQFADASFDTLGYDVVNMHPLSNMKGRGKQFNLGGFMRGCLCLHAFRDYCLHMYHEPKPLNLDEDNAASQYRDAMGWTIHRKRAWMALLCGAHYDVIDFTINNHLETGTEACRKGLQAWFGHLSRFIHSLDLAHSRPHPGITIACPDHCVATAFGVGGKDIALYIADERERTDAACGQPIQGDILLNLPAGTWEIRHFSPVTGLYSPAIHAEGGAPVTVMLALFTHDTVVRARRV